MSDRKRMYIVMDHSDSGDLQAFGLPSDECSIDGCVGFIAIFEDYNKALDWAVHPSYIKEIGIISIEE